MRPTPLLALFALACSTENTLSGEKEDEGTFETGSTWEPPQVETGDTQVVDEACNGVDDDGDGTIDEGFPDDDGNGRVDCLDDVCPTLDLGSAAAVSITEECQGTTDTTSGEEVDDPWNVVTRWTYGSGQSSWMTPVIGNLDDDNGDGVIDEDDTPEIVVSLASGKVVALSGADGSVVWTANGTNMMGGTSIADVDADGRPDVIAADTQGRTISLDGSTGAVQWTADDMLASLNYMLHNTADLDEDGIPEVIHDQYVLDGRDGSTLFKMDVPTSGWNYRLPAIADVDLDGDQEIALEGALYDSDGDELWSTGESGSYGFWPIIIQADSDDEAEIGFVGEHWSLWDHDGNNIYTTTYNTTAQPGPPCAGDFDGDGTAEVAWPAYQNFVMYELDGSKVWSVNMNDTSGLAGCSGYDLNNDGALEILFADQTTFTIFDGATGAELFTDTHASPTIFEYPTVADVDNDGHAEIVVAHYGAASAVTVYGHGGDGWPAAGTTWNVHDFAITNINPDGSVPQEPDPSWLKYNVYRARVAVDDPSTPDLAVSIQDVCVADCDYGPVEVGVQVWNEGGADVSAGAVLSLYADDDTGPRWVASATLGAVTAGTSLDAVTFELAPADVGMYGFIAVIDDGDAISECVEDNNDDTWAEVYCP
jgi:hypothetical protein